MESNQNARSLQYSSNTNNNSSRLLDRPIHYDFSLKKPFPARKTLEELLAEGYVGVDYRLATNHVFAGIAYKFRNQIKWTISQPNEDEEIWLMTTDKKALQQLAEFMLEKFNWSPIIYKEKPLAPFIFIPKNSIERAAIEVTISGDYGWQGSLYSLEIHERQEKEVGMIFATKPLDSPNQEWLLVKLNIDECTGSWSLHHSTLEQVYYIWKENITLAEPNYEPTSDELLDAIRD